MGGTGYGAVRTSFHSPLHYWGRGVQISASGEVQVRLRRIHRNEAAAPPTQGVLTSESSQAFIWSQALVACGAHLCGGGGLGVPAFHGREWGAWRRLYNRTTFLLSIASTHSNIHRLGLLDSSRLIFIVCSLLLPGASFRPQKVTNTSLRSLFQWIALACGAGRIFNAAPHEKLWNFPVSLSGVVCIAAHLTQPPENGDRPGSWNVASLPAPADAP